MALLSALVFQEKSDVEPALPPALAAATEQLVAIAHETGIVQAEAGLPLHPDEWARSVLKFGLVEVSSLCTSNSHKSHVTKSTTQTHRGATQVTVTVAVYHSRRQ